MNRSFKPQLETLEGREAMSAGTTLASVTDLVLDPFNPSSGGSGRITAIVADPADTNTIYVGTANGGVWKTTDGGTSSAPGVGYLRSIDGGKTWST